MLTLKDIKNTYWNGEGKHQKFVNEKLNNIEELPINKTLKSKYQKMARAYYRFYNDGDTPRHEVFEQCENNREIVPILENEINKIIEDIQQKLSC